jgi:hypothetical protein
MPAEVREALASVHIRLQWGPHSRRAFAEDFAGDGLPRPEVIKGSECEAVEAEVSDGKVVKMVFRRPHSRQADLVLVVQDNGFVRTCWGNVPGDTHRTLDRKKYAKA